jgi:fermentation-respiration switch protein FrsA (DUF1100 family)
VAEARFPIIPACLMMWDERWESIDRIADIAAPLLVLHGDADRIIPVSQGQSLFDAAAEPKRLIVYPGGRHSDLRLHGAGIDVVDWLADLGLS